ncbi:hypothetical protein EJ04DRAFT_574877 [Polyplosphaeria fusca]|uniref:Uncharacterized protein n=1 Tax=Polyplosphaeria fusca TaxID=682080 RepID=A0A9P4R4U5_9PLEO|nr:hypothetical protein EJ04DRAFT_574877 [Polyplosphaeria fusca]
MFSRAVPRAASRLGRLAQCEAQSQAHGFYKLPARAWRSPVEQRCTRRHMSSILQQARDLNKESPVLFPFAIGVILLGLCTGGIYLPWYYKNVIVKPYHNYPEPVAKELRKAVYYSKQKEMVDANKYFTRALAEASRCGMDQFSPEILGIKLGMSGAWQVAGRYPAAAEVLEIMRSDCWDWLDERGDAHQTDGNRTRILKVIVELDVRLGELYVTPYVNEPENAEKVLVEAVETALNERNRRTKDGVKEGEGDWMTDEELGGTLETLGHHYEQFDAHYLATPLFLQALALCPPTSCHSVVLMNNVSTCLAQQKPPPTLPATLSKGSTSSANTFPAYPPPPRAVLIDQARQWAQKAIDRAATITPQDRNDDCDSGCATATHNLGEFLEMEGRVNEARAKYQEAQSLARSVGFKEGVAQAKEALKRLDQK